MRPDGSAGYYESLDFNSPMTDATADHVVARVVETGPASIVDVGCGWAELLLRILAACPMATGHGIDRDDAFIGRARRNAERRSLSGRVTFSADLDLTDPADTVLCIGSEHVLGTVQQALDGLRDLARPGGRLLLGTLIWERPPTPELLEAFGDLPTLDELIALAVERGWRPLDLLVASRRDWDRFEFGFMADWEQAVMAATDPAAADEARRVADEYRRDYLKRRGVLGFAYLTLGRPAADPVARR